MCMYVYIYNLDVKCLKFQIINKTRYIYLIRVARVKRIYKNNTFRTNFGCLQLIFENERKCILNWFVR